jgi:hypothetical protein
MPYVIRYTVHGKSRKHKRNQQWRIWLQQVEQAILFFTHPNRPPIEQILQKTKFMDEDKTTIDGFNELANRNKVEGKRRNTKHISQNQ